MKYFTQIEVYLKRQLTSAEQQAFEDELQENEVLRQELEAFQLTQELFDFTTKHLTEAQITSVEQPDVPAQNSYKYSRTQQFVTSVILLSLFGFFANYFLLKKETESPIDRVNIEIPNDKLKQPAQQAILPLDSKATPKKTHPIFIEVEEALNIEKSKPIKKTPNTSRPIADASLSKKTTIVKTAKGDMVSADKIANGTNVVYKAKNSITLNPGFYAESGASFTAIIEEDKK